MTDIGIVVTLIISFFNSFLLTRQLKQQRKIEDNKISADIMSKSRIEWIQSVRKLTAETLSAFNHLYIVDFECAHKYRQGEYKKELEIASDELTSKINELILYFAVSKSGTSFDLNIQGEMLSTPNQQDLNYFSPEEISNHRKKEQDDMENTQIKKEKNKIILKPLYESKTNKDKNKLIVTLLEELIKSSRVQFFEYHKDIEDRKIKNLPIKYNYSAVYNSRIDTCKHYMDELRNIIALYLKIEWDRAKIGR
ncbi:hypothetical protein [Leuconostoc mesenteroides]|uniref:hypothetical protein n=1 Tax=Leuconostoc mesenteroides TaxID=1245 RepID=UPI00236019E7|nr:hypothetical protein [Leuconostoc mesenteroides]